MESSRLRIVGLGWYRTYLLVSCEGGSPKLIRSDGRALAFGPVPEGLPSNHGMCLNVANAPARSLLPKGEWTFCDAEGQPAVVSDELLERIEDFTRSFFFAKGKKLYSVRFLVPAHDFEAPQLHIRVDYYRRDAKPRRDLSFVKFAKRCMNAYYQVLCKLHPKKGNRVLLMTENGTELSGNLAAIDRRLQERGLAERFEVSRSARNIFTGKQDVFAWLRTLSLIARQDYIFVEDYVPIFAAINLDPRTKFVQVWHAGFGFKLVGFGRFGIDSSPNPFASCHRKYTWALVGNGRLRDVYAEVFGIEREALLATGMPRLDHFLDSNRLERCRAAFLEQFSRFVGRKVILFAPTYRGANQKEAYYDFAKIDFTALADYCRRTQSAVIFKMHRFIEDAVPLPPGTEDVFADASACDINDLMPSADVLVTDYSSCFYDYLLLGNPVVFYAYDEAYYTATRGVHRPLSAIAPGSVCHTFEELLAALSYACSGDCKLADVRDMLIDRAAEQSGLASDRVIDFILLDVDDGDVCIK